MNLKQFKYVLTLNNEGCFSKAADVLNISQPSLSQYIKKIEKELGVELFDRSGGNVRLTDAGRVYIEAGKKILDIKHDMSLKFMDISENKTGSITIGTSPFRSAVMMPKIVKEFKKLYPGITLIIKEGNTDELINGILHGEFDIALTVYQDELLNLNMQKIGVEEFVLAVPSSFEQLNAKSVTDRKYKAISIAEMSKYEFVLLNESLFMQKTLSSLCQKYSLELKSGICANSLEAQIAFVRAGLGAAFVPSGIEALCGKDEVELYSFTEELPKREIVAISGKEKQNSTIINELLKIAEKAF